MCPPEKARDGGHRGLVGAILAGGRACRLGGGDKCLLTVGGRPILTRVAKILRASSDCVILNANGDPGRFASHDLTVVGDTLPGHLGPLAGVLAALEWAAAHDPEAAEVVTAPADTPFLPHDLVEALTAARRRAGATVACARSNGMRHPTAAVWPVALRDELRHAVAEEGLRRAGDFLARHAVVYAEWSDLPIDPFFNVNTPADLGLANALAQRAEQAR